MALPTWSYTFSGANAPNFEKTLEYTTTFIDNFDNPRTIGGPSITPSNPYQQWFTGWDNSIQSPNQTVIYTDSSNPFSISSSVLTMTATKQLDNGGHYTGVWKIPHLNTLDENFNGFTFINGYLEMRFKTSKNVAAHPALWSRDPIKYRITSEDYTEIDSAEFAGGVINQQGESSEGYVQFVDHIHPGIGSSTVHDFQKAHYDGKSPPPNLPAFTDLSSTWHYYGLWFQPTLLTAFLDHKEVAYTSRPAVLYTPNNIMLTLAIQEPGDTSQVGPVTVQVDYVKLLQAPGQN